MVLAILQWVIVYPIDHLGDYGLRLKQFYCLYRHVLYAHQGRQCIFHRTVVMLRAR